MTDFETNQHIYQEPKEFERDESALQQHMQNHPSYQPQEQQQFQTQEETYDAKPEEPENKSQSTKEYNMRVLREKWEQAERRAKELEQYVQTIAATREQPRPAPASNAVHEEEEIQLQDDEIPTWGQLKKYNQRIEGKLNRLREETLRSQAENKNLSDEQRFKSQHPDADKVLSKENIALLQQIYPEEYESIASNKNVYSQLKTAYNMINRYGLIQEEKKETRLAQNITKPRPAQTMQAQYGDNPLAKIDQYGRMRLEEQDREQILALSRKYRGY